MITLPDTDQMYEVSIEIHNHTDQNISAYGQCKMAHKDLDEPKEFIICKQPYCHIKKESPLNFIYELSTVKAGPHRCQLDNKYFKRLLFQPFLESNPHRGSYILTVNPKSGCQIKHNFERTVQEQSWLEQTLYPLGI